MDQDILHLLEGIAHVLDMSDPDHPTFADSAADCLDALLALETPLRALLVEFGRGSIPAQTTSDEDHCNG